MASDTQIRVQSRNFSNFSSDNLKRCKQFFEFEEAKSSLDFDPAIADNIIGESYRLIKEQEEQEQPQADCGFVFDNGEFVHIPWLWVLHNPGD